MNFQDVLQDIAQNLVGKRLQSISGRSDITLDQVDFGTGLLSLTATNGNKITRKFSELEEVWNELMRLPAVHVDSTLSGSGSSRSHPETILANLPYIQWFRYEGRKHIAYVPKKQRPFGQLKEMDTAIAASTSKTLNDVG